MTLSDDEAGGFLSLLTGTRLPPGKKRVSPEAYTFIEDDISISAKSSSTMVGQVTKRY